MSAAATIGVVVAALVFVVLIIAIVVAVVRRRPGTLSGTGVASDDAIADQHAEPFKDRPAGAPGRGPTGQHPDPIAGTPADTSTPHWDRRIDPNEGPQ